MASGSEVNLIAEAGKRLTEKGAAVRLVSFPSWELFAEQEESYRDSVLPPGTQLRLAVEAGVSQGWHRWVGPQGRIQGLDRYGSSAPAGQVFNHLGFSVDHLEKMAWELLHP